MKSTDYQLNTFLQYVRTKQFMLNALKGIEPDTFVHISKNEINKRFLVNPCEDLQSLVDAGEIEVKRQTNKKGHKFYSYKVLKTGYYDLTLLEHKGQSLDHITAKMMSVLMDVTLKLDTPSTEYFNSFLDNRNHLLRVFFNVDVFSGRVHTPVTSFKSEYRKNILIDGEETTSLDVVTMQPVLLGKILTQTIGDNEFSQWINEGKDIYIMLQSKAQLNTRDEAKKRFFEILFSRPNDSLQMTFGNSNWITWINEFKNKPFTPNPHTLEKNHSNLAWLLQKNEVQIMRKVWEKLLIHDIKFLSVHDEIIVKRKDKVKSKELFKSVLSSELTYYQLSEDKHLPDEVIVNPEERPSVPIERIPKGKLFYRYELINKFNLPDEDINKHFEECFSGALWMPFHEFQSNRL